MTASGATEQLLRDDAQQLTSRRTAAASTASAAPGQDQGKIGSTVATSLKP